MEHSQLKGKVVATRRAYRRTKKYNLTRTLLTSAHVKVPIQNEGKLGPPCEPPLETLLEFSQDFCGASHHDSPHLVVVVKKLLSSTASSPSVRPSLIRCVPFRVDGFNYYVTSLRMPLAATNVSASQGTRPRGVPVFASSIKHHVMLTHGESRGFTTGTSCPFSGSGFWPASMTSNSG